MSPRSPRPQTVLTVVRTERISPHLVRVHLGGAGFAAFLDAADPAKLATTDKYVKMLFARPELGLTPPYDLDALRAGLAPEDMPVRRTYTIRSVGAESLAIDFVVHGEEGIAGPWAASARPGDLAVFNGPGGMYTPSDEATHLLLGDDSAIPAIAAALEAMSPDATGLALIEVAGAADEVALRKPEGVELRWLHRDGREEGTVLSAAVAELHRIADPVDVFAHGERGAMKAIRAVLQEGWGLERRALSLSAYWALGRAEDTFQAEKREPVGVIFAD